MYFGFEAHCDCAVGAIVPFPKMEILDSHNHILDQMTLNWSFFKRRKFASEVSKRNPLSVWPSLGHAVSIVIDYYKVFMLTDHFGVGLPSHFCVPFSTLATSTNPNRPYVCRCEPARVAGAVCYPVEEARTSLRQQEGQTEARSDSETPQSDPGA